MMRSLTIIAVWDCCREPGFPVLILEIAPECLLLYNFRMVHFRMVHYSTTIDDNGESTRYKGQRICVNTVITHTAITGEKITNAR